MITNYFSSTSKALQEIPKAKAGSLVYVESPTEDELRLLEQEHGLDIDLLRDGLDPNEAPRIDDYEKRTYIYARYVLPASERQSTSPILIVFGVDMLYVVTPEPFSELQRLLDTGRVTTSKRAQTLLQILSVINRGYRISIIAIAKRIRQIRSQLVKDQIENKDFISFIDIEEDLNDFILALEPMNDVLNNLLAGKSVRLYEDDKDLMEDLELGSEELIRQSTSLLSTIRNIRDAYSTITANNLNKVLKLMTGITLLVGVCTLVTGAYGMNVILPHTEGTNAFWFILGGLGLFLIAGFYYFKKNKWF